MCRSRLVFCLCLTAAAVSLRAAPARAAWSTRSAVNNPVCVGTGDNLLRAAIADGTGGFYVSWDDTRTGAGQPFVQHMDGNGSPVAGWPANGIAACGAAGNQLGTVVALDGAGGVFVAWTDRRTPLDEDIYLQRLTGPGAVASGWPADGLKISLSGFRDYSPRILADGSGGAYVVYESEYTSTDIDLYANHITANGTPSPGWAATGMSIDNATSNQTSPSITSDGAGGMFVTYSNRPAGAYRVSACRVPAGAPTLSWSIVDITSGGGVSGGQTNPSACSDGSGGCFVAWSDSRGGVASHLYGEHLSASGSLLWSSIGTPIEVGTDYRSVADLIHDGDDGAMLLVLSGSGALTLHHLQSGPGETPGFPTTLGFSANYFASIALDGSGGAFIGASPVNFVTTDIRAGRVTSTGDPSVGWPSIGAPVGTAGSNQAFPRVIADGAGNAILVWEDYRNATTNSADLYAQRIDRFGALGDASPKLTSVRDVAGDQGGKVRLQWNASYLDQFDPGRITDYRIWRQTPASLALTAKRTGATVLSAIPATDALEAATASGQRVFMPNAANDQYAWEYLASQPASGFASYSYVAATVSDSLAGSNPRTVFMVQAHWNYGAFWNSAPDSGYSVDNLPPLAPAPFTGTYAVGNTSLSWGENREADLAGYRLYRGASLGFVPGPGNLVASTSSLGFIDATASPAVYKLAAIDAHGNQSGFTTWVAPGTLATDGPTVPTEVWFGSPSQNPVRSGTTLRFGLPRGAAVSLALYDQQGRRVRTLVSGTLAAGEHDARWDGHNDAGHRVAPGMYFARFMADGKAFTLRLVTLR